jgi:leucyl aminopeptidase (aminopeptidase T)
MAIKGENAVDVRSIDLVKVLRKPLELNAKAGDKILIITDTRMDPILWESLAVAARTMDVEPAIALMPARATHSTDPMRSICAAALDPSTDLCIYLTSTAMAHARFNDEMIDAGKRFILMEELTPAMLSPDGPAGADYAKIGELGDKLAKVFTGGKRVRVTAKNGTNLTASIEGRVGRSIAGVPLRLHPGKGGGCAFPDGEAHVCPVEGTGEGTVVFDLTAHSVGAIREPMKLTIEKGMVTKIEGGREAAIWRDILERYGDAPSFNCPAEVAIGLNPKVTPTGSMRTDKKMYATSHIGMGDTIALGGTCHAKLRLEGVIREPEIEVDGQVLTRDGKILVA